jgi:signal transduction histidine kinase
VGELTTAVPLEVIERWSGRWRYPGVAAALHSENAVSLVTPLVSGLLRPAAEPAEAVERLLADGEFDAAESLDAAHEGVAQARALAVRSLTRQLAELTLRAQRVDMRLPDPGDALEAVSRRGSAVDKWIAEQRRELQKREFVYGNALKAEAAAMAQGRQAWLATVEQCVTDHEYPAAKQMLRDGPGQEDPPDPAVVPRPGTWPFGDNRLSTVLSWYGSGVIGTPLGFIARWRPAPDDTAGHRLVAAVAAVHTEATTGTVVELAAAIDAFAGVEGVRHPVTPRGDGFVVTLSGLASPRFNRLALPAEHHLWVPAKHGAECPADAGDLVVYGGATDRPDGVPTLIETDLLRLVAPDADGRARPAAQRQINLLRLLGADMPESRIWRAARPGDEPERLRDDLRWTLDLLGLRHTSSVVDALMYDLSARADAIAVALRQLVPPPGQRFDLTVDDLAAWRQDPVRMDRLCQGVAEAIEAEGAPAAVFYALVARADDLDADAHADAINGILRDLLTGTGTVTDVPADELLRAFDATAAITEAVGSGLAVRDGERLRLRPGGLPALFTARGVDALPGLAYRALVRGYHQGRERERRDDRYRKILTDLMHSQKAVTNLIQEVVAKLRDPEGKLSTENRTDLERRHDEMMKQLRRDQELGVSLDQAKLVLREAVDLGRVLRDVRRRVLTISPPRVQTDVRLPAEPCLVWANPYDLEHSFFGIVQNAVKAIVSTGDLSGTVEIGMESDGDRATVRITDSGPGIPAHLRPVLWSPERRIEAKMSGIGLVYARDTMTFLGGSLNLDESTAAGAKFVVLLPLHRPAHHSLNGGI